MEAAQRTPPETQLGPENRSSDSGASPQNQETIGKAPDSGSNDLRKACTPDRLKVPKAFKYPERYRSPTDSILSPVTKGLLARHRRPAGAPAAALLPPILNRPQIHDLLIQDVTKVN